MATEEIQNLIIKVLLGEASEQEARTVQEWRNASAENQKLYEDFAKIWHVSPQAEPENIPNPEQEWNSLAQALNLSTGKARVVSLPKAEPRSSRWFQQTQYWLAAAAVLVVILGALWFNRLDNNLVEVATAIGETKRVELPDGSIVRLNAVSKISFVPELAGAERIVHLDGEAFFDVQREASAPEAGKQAGSEGGRPFIVVTENARVHVLGTEFNVWARQAETRVIVQEGRVALQTSRPSEPQRLILTANQMGTCVQDTLSHQPMIVDAVQRLGWLQGRIVFSKAPLREVVAELQRLYNVHIELAQPGLETETLTAAFEQKSVEQVLESICLAMDLKLSGVGNSYRIDEVR